MKGKARSEPVQKLTAVFRKYQYVALVLLVGAVLLMVPSGREEDSEPETVPVILTEEKTMEQKLEELLRQVQGAGEVSVMLTVAEGEYTVFQTDSVTEDRTGAETAERSVSTETVFSDSGSSENAAIPVQIKGPVYQGAVVVAEGADQAAVRLDLMNAVSSLTGLGADKITVIKMKTN